MHMPHISKILLFFIYLISISLPAWAAQAPALPIITASLHSETDAISTGKPLRLGVLLKPSQPGWHTYWENPGDAGLPTAFSWTLPPGFTAGDIDWPPPMRISEGPLAIYGYEGEAFLPVTITPPATLDAKTPYTFHVNASWLVCNNICIPESAELEITLPANAPSPALFAAHDKKKPQKIAQAFSYRIDGDTLSIEAPLSALGIAADTIKNAALFIRQPMIIKYAADSFWSVENNIVRVTARRTEDAPPPAANISGVLMVDNKYFDVTASPLRGEADAKASGGGDAVVAKNTPSLTIPPQGGGDFFTILLFALLGGLILNLMPCVLPVLSLKLLAVVKKSGGARRHVLAHGIAYTLGIMVSFGAFSALLLILRQGGEAIGWGFQMQSPAFVGFLIYLLFLVGLSLSGFFHLPVLLGNFGGSVTNENSTKGSFATGVLATAVATPCTAPFMASAVGAALTLPAWQSMLIFEALALGLALPFLLISIFPRLIRFLPKPGVWMEKFKHLLAFPMYASVVWLLWVLAQQTGAGGMAVAVAGMLIITVAIWIKNRAAALAMIAAVLIFSLPLLRAMELDNMPMPSGDAMQDVKMAEFSPQALNELRAKGAPVFVDATAAWCITCQVNARVAIHTERTMQAFKDHGVTLMIADWTRRNADITKFLESFGYQGVPLTVYFPPHGEPVVLPQLLTEDTVIGVIAK